MLQRYQNIMVAVDGSHEAELAFEKGVNVALRNNSRLTIAHVIDTRALQSVSTFDSEVYEELQEDAKKLMDQYAEKAKEAGVGNVVTVVEMGNPKTLLATDIPEEQKVDLIMVGATGLNAGYWLALHLNTSCVTQKLTCLLSVIKKKHYNTKIKRDWHKPVSPLFYSSFFSQFR